ncbi:MAG: hypothetical protein AAF678_13275 [Pseudomonadota bacterium]
MEVPLRFAVLISIICLSGCVSRDDPMAIHSLVREVDLIGTQKLIICTKDPAVCDEQAARTCPTGYDVLRTNINDPDPWRKSLVIRCT